MVSVSERVDCTIKKIHSLCINVEGLYLYANDYLLPVNGIHPTPASVMPSSFYAASSINVLPDPTDFELHLPADCEQVCSNTFGSYTCSCVSGYQLAPDGKSCIGEYISLITTLPNILPT